MNPSIIARIIAIKLNETREIMLFTVLVTSGLMIIRIPMVIHIALRSWVKYTTASPRVMARVKRRAWRMYILLRLKLAFKTSCRDLRGALMDFF